MTSYNAVATLAGAGDMTDDQCDAILDALVGFSPALGFVGDTTLTVTYPAADLGRALVIVGVIRRALPRGVDVVGLEVVPADVYDRRVAAAGVAAA